MNISVVIITFQAERYLQQCLSALTLFDEIIVLDNGSTDKTLEIAKTFNNVKIFQSNFIGFGPLKNKAASLATHDWIFSIDSDEMAEPALVAEIIHRNWKENEVGELLRWNYYKEKHIDACGWGNDWLPRVYNRKNTKFTDAQVHENIMVDNQKVVRLAGKIHHYSYQNVNGLIQKMQRYSSLFAENHAQNPKKRLSLLMIAIKTFFAFIKNYFLQKGIFYGYEGLLISTTNALTTFYKYMKIRDNSQHY